MKPLTIEELRNLPVGDWVWIVDEEDGVSFYARHDEECCVTMHPKTHCDEFAYTSADEFGAYDFTDYGKTWLAYRNKEQAEARGEIVELPCKTETLHVGDTVYYIQSYFNEATLRGELHVKRTTIDYLAKDYIEVNNGLWLSTHEFWLIPEEAERRLAELKGE